jgi:four helix bundle protein
MPVYDIRERTFEFAKSIVLACIALDSDGWVVRALGHQLLASGTSIGANLQEARGGQSSRDSAAKIFIALKEARETLYWLRLISVCVPSRRDAVKPLASEANELVAVLTTIARRAKARS